MTFAGASDIADVAIVGGGPGGLALANGLLSAWPDLKVKVFERSSKLFPLGAAVTIPANGICAMEMLSEAGTAMLKEKALKLISVDKYNQAGELESTQSFSYEPTAEKPNSRTPIMIRWHDLQTGLAELLPPGVFHLDHQFESLTQDDESVTISFKGQPDQKARIVVGADGNMSALRNFLFNDSAQLDYTGTAVWRMTMPIPQDWTLAKPGMLTVWSGSKQIILFRTLRDCLTTSGIAPWPAERLPELQRKSYYGNTEEDNVLKAGNEKLDRFLSLFSNFPPDVIDVFKRTDPNSILEHGIYQRPLTDEWGVGRVTLMGDAAHVLPPNMGQGTPMAWEDALQLTHSLCAHGLTPEALREYEKIQQKRVAPVSTGARENMDDYYQRGMADKMPFNSGGFDKMVIAHINNFNFKPVKGLREAVPH